MTTVFTEFVVNIIKNIPQGRVMSYGMVAACAGNPRGARQVAWILHSSSEKYDLPWHRVVNRLGEISFRSAEGNSLQRQLLEAEGVHFNDQGRIDLAAFGAFAEDGT
jgi:methylated-DNA-protein-cysteine methyltransferase related protein